MPRKRILVTGSRDWTDWLTVRTVLAVAAVGHWPDEMTLVHGGAEGLDRIAAGIATDWRWNIEAHPVPAVHHRAQPLWRNEHMVNLGADLCWAFVNPCAKPRCAMHHAHGSHGSMHCGNAAEAAGIPTKWVRRYEQ